MDTAEYNTKIKVFKDGTTNITYCSDRVFGQKTIKETDDKEKEIDFEMRSGYDKGLLRCHPDNTEWEYDRKLKKDLEEYQESWREYDRNCRKRTDTMKRAKDKVFDIVYQNEFVYFVTPTLRVDDSIDRTDPKAVLKKLSKWLNNQQQRKGLSYLLIPEYHENGGIHAHALINDTLQFADSGRRIYKGKAWKIEDLQNNHVYWQGLKPVYNISDWKYGFSTAIPLDGERLRVAHYVTKYITKDCKKIFGKYYWSSRDLIRDTETIYTNTDFESLNLKEYQCTLGMRFKYESPSFSHSDNSPDIEQHSITAEDWEKPPEIDYSNIPWE